MLALVTTGVRSKGQIPGFVVRGETIRACATASSARAWHAGGQGFESLRSLRRLASRRMTSATATRVAVPDVFAHERWTAPREWADADGTRGADIIEYRP